MGSTTLITGKPTSRMKIGTSDTVLEVDIRSSNGGTYQIDCIPTISASSKAEGDCSSQIKHSKFYNHEINVNTGSH